MKKIFLFALTFSAITMGVAAQSLVGDISPLKGQKEVNVVIDFSGTLINNQPEEAYISLHTKEKNDEDKADWLREWNEEMPEDSYEQFILYLNEEISKKGITAGDFPNSEYTIRVKVINISPGYSQWGNSNVGLHISFIKTGQTTPFASIEYKRIWAIRSALYAHHLNRICRAFSNVGMNLGKMISKNLK